MRFYQFLEMRFQSHYCSRINFAIHILKSFYNISPLVIARLCKSRSARCGRNSPSPANPTPYIYKATLQIVQHCRLLRYTNASLAMTKNNPLRQLLSTYRLLCSLKILLISKYNINIPPLYQPFTAFINASPSL